MKIKVNCTTIGIDGSIISKAGSGLVCVEK